MQNKKDVIRTAFIGFGRRGKTLCGHLTSRSDILIVAICDPVINNTPFRHYSDPEKMLKIESIDLVIITIPPAYQFDMIVLCSSYGIPVICEKPGLISNNDCDHIALLKTKIYFAFQMEYAPLIQASFNMVSGKILRISASQRVKLTQSLWRFNIDQAAGGTLLDNSSHFIHLVISRFGIPLRVFAYLGVESDSVEQNAESLLVYDTFYVTIHSSWQSATGKKNTLHIQCENNDVIFEETHQSARVFSTEQRTSDSWTEHLYTHIFPSRGLERDIESDPYGAARNQSDVDVMLSAYITDIRKNGVLSKKNIYDTVATQKNHIHTL